MGLLDWMKRYREVASSPEPEDHPASPRHFTRKGNAITQMSRSTWHSDDSGLYEFRHHVGRSVEGYHGGLEISYRGGEGPFSWSNARSTADAAEKVSNRMRDAWERGPEVNSQVKQLAGDEMPFRFQKRFAHLEHLMSPEERKVLDAIEVRWKEQYDRVKDYPPASEGQEHEMAVFKAIDRVHKALDARENARFENWKRLESDVDKAIGKVRRAFAVQRKYVAREVTDAEEYTQKLAPDHRSGGPTRSRGR